MKLSSVHFLPFSHFSCNDDLQRNTGWNQTELRKRFLMFKRSFQFSALVFLTTAPSLTDQMSFRSWKSLITLTADKLSLERVNNSQITIKTRMTELSGEGDFEDY